MTVEAVSEDIGVSDTLDAADMHTFGLRNLLEPGAFVADAACSYENHRITQTLRGLGIDPASLSTRERAWVHRALMDGNFIADAQAGTGLATARFYSTYAILDATTLTQKEVEQRLESADAKKARAEIAALPEHEKRQLVATAKNLASLIGETDRLQREGADEQEYQTLWNRFVEATPQTGTVDQIFHIARPQSAQMAGAVGTGLASLATQAVSGMQGLDVKGMFNFNVGDVLSPQDSWLGESPKIHNSHAARVQQERRTTNVPFPN